MRSALISGAVALCAAGAAMADNERYDNKGFSTVEAASGLVVEIVEGDGFSVSADGSSRALKRLRISQSGEVLSLRLDRKGLDLFSPILWVLEDEVSVEITLPELAGVIASSGSDVDVTGASARVFSAQSRSGATLAITGIDAGSVRIETSSGADLTAQGRCTDLRVSASSGSGLHAGSLACASAMAAASSGADIALRAGTVDAAASSGAAVDVWGADELQRAESTGGSVTRH